MARAIDWARYDQLKAQGHSERDIAGALGFPRTSIDSSAAPRHRDMEQYRQRSTRDAGHS